MTQHREVDAFAAAAKEFRLWVNSGPHEGAEGARLALSSISSLYALALQLPLPLEDAEPVATELWVNSTESESVLRRLADLPLQYYSEVFDPLPVPAGDEPLVGDLCDDIRDMYIDIVTGLLRYEDSQPDEAVGHWVFFLWHHWGEHATSAMRVLHAYLAQPAD